MFGIGLIVFRETLEAALFVGIIAASTRGIFHRTRWLTLGASAGVLGSIIMASAMGRISAWADGVGQELVSVVILSVAIAMLAWHCIWVGAHSADMAKDARHVGESAARGEQTLWALAIAVGLAVLREGAETVLFVAGLVSGTTEGPLMLAGTVAAGLALGASVGWLIYAGLGKVSPHRLFAVTNVLVLLLAGSLASQLARTMSQAGWLDLLDNPAWDISALMPNDSVPGMVLHGVIGYDASPSQLQLAFFAGTTLLIWLAARQLKARVSRRRSAELSAA